MPSTRAFVASVDWSNACGPRRRTVRLLGEPLERRTVRLQREGNRVTVRVIVIVTVIATVTVTVSVHGENVLLLLLRAR